MSVRFEKILLELTPKLRQIDTVNMVKGWGGLSDYDLRTDITRELVSSGMASSTSHYTFVRELYPNITDDALRKRVDNILLAMAEPEYLEHSKIDTCRRALYACLKLNIAGGRERLARMVQYIDNPLDSTYHPMVSWLNAELLRDYPIPEAEQFLVRQVESAPPDIAELLKDPRLIPHNEYNRLMDLYTALQRLNSVNAKVARRYAEKLKLPI